MDKTVIERTEQGQRGFDLRVPPYIRGPKEGSHIRTQTGIDFDIVDPDTWVFNMTDISFSLSNLCRFSGHLNRFYSVAEHSVRVSERLKSWGAPPDVQLLGLIHDATEAYLLDIPRPWKPLVWIGDTSYEELETDMMRAIVEWHISERVDIAFAWINSWDLVRRADMHVYEEEERGRRTIEGVGRLTPHEAMVTFSDLWLSLRSEVRTGDSRVPDAES